MIQILFYCNKSIEVLEQIVNNELDLLSTWFRANKLSVDVDKTNFILFLNLVTNDIHKF